MRVRPGVVYAQACQVLSVAQGLLGEGGAIDRYWTEGGLGDQPADLWDLVERTSRATKKYLAKKRK